MGFKFLSKGGSGSVASSKRTAISENSKKVATKSKATDTEVNVGLELGALKLGEDELAAFEKWMTEPNNPSDLMVEAARVHRVIRFKLQRS